MRKIIFRNARSFTAIFALFLVVATGLVSDAYGDKYEGPTQVITVYFAGTILRSNTVFHYGGGTANGQHSVPELLQYLYHNQDDSDPNQHRIWVDGIGNDNALDAGLAARHANRCKIKRIPKKNPWDPKKKDTVQFIRSGWVGIIYYTGGFECWDYRLHEALDTNPVIDLFKIMDTHRTSPIILNIVGHSRGGILAMMLADRVSKLQRRYDVDSDLIPEYERFLKINIINFDAVPGSPDQIGLHDENKNPPKFVKSHEYFNLSPRVSNYVGLYAKDERQNIFEAVIPHHTPKTKSWHLAFNGAHQSLVGNPRRDGHKYHALASQDYSQPLEVFSIRGYHSTLDSSASGVGIVTSIIARELLSTADWGRVKFRTSWRSGDSDLHYGSANCEGNEQICAQYFMNKYSNHLNMSLETRSTMRSVANPKYSIIVPEGGLQAWDFAANRCSIRIINHPQFSKHGTEHGKCTFKAKANGDLEHVNLIDKSPDLSGSGIMNITAEKVCQRLAEFTNLPWKCTQ